MPEFGCSEPLLQLKDLGYGWSGRAPLLRAANLILESGEAMALTGPSGCGKSILARVLCGFPPPGLHWTGTIAWNGLELGPGQENSADWVALRGGTAGLVLQEPHSSLNPVLRVGSMLAEAVKLGPDHPSSIQETVLNLLREVRIPEPERVARSYPYQLSGGMRQRVLLAAALARRPRLLLADEITASLDTTVQKEILELIHSLRRQRNMALLFISHEPDLAAFMTDSSRQFVDGRLVPGIFASEMVSRREVSFASADDRSAVLSARHVSVIHRQQKEVVSGVSLELVAGRMVALVGESGCGKTSLARALARQIPVTRGEIHLGDDDWLGAGGEALRRLRRRVQLVFQDPAESLNPRLRVGTMLTEAAGKKGPSPDDLLVEVGLDPALSMRFPHQLSGGQRQRVALARALAPSPAVLMTDEPTSALDPQATLEIMDLLVHLMAKRQLALLLISHDLDLLRHRAHQIIVMQKGRVVEVLEGPDLEEAVHPYTRTLLAARPSALRADHHVPSPQKNRASNPGE